MKGWYYEGWRHSLASKGVKTSQPKLAKSLRIENVIFEPKFDGTRMIVKKEDSHITFINRRGVIKDKTYPELADLHKNIKGDAILDGEVVALDQKHPYGNFKKLAQRDRLQNPEEIKIRSKTLPLTFVAFDILKKDNECLKDLPLAERKKILDNTIRQGPRIREIEFSNKSDVLLQKIKKAHGEGIVQKDVNSKYASGSTRSWEKYKLLKTNDVAVVGATEGMGKRKGYFGALNIAVNTSKGLRSVGKVGTGFTEVDLKEIKDKLNKGEKLVARIEYRKIGSAGHYIEPRFSSLRYDISQNQTHS